MALGKGLLPPYGPTSGMIQALQLMRKTTPQRVDSDFLRSNRIAPGNEYKVVGALKFLGVLDADGHPTEKSRLLKTRGATYTLALQEIVRSAYRGLFSSLRGKDATRENIYNYFVTEGELGAEMAAKATRFFIQLCRLAAIEIAPEVQAARGERKRRSPRPRKKPPPRPATQPRAAEPVFPLVFALTPEMADMDQEKLTELFRKMRTAFRESLAEEGD